MSLDVDVYANIKTSDAETTVRHYFAILRGLQAQEHGFEIGRCFVEATPLVPLLLDLKSSGNGLSIEQCEESVLSIPNAHLCDIYCWFTVQRPTKNIEAYRFDRDKDKPADGSLFCRFHFRGRSAQADPKSRLCTGNLILVAEYESGTYLGNRFEYALESHLKTVEKFSELTKADSLWGVSLQYNDNTPRRCFMVYHLNPNDFLKDIGLSESAVDENLFLNAAIEANAELKTTCNGGLMVWSKMFGTGTLEKFYEYLEKQLAGTPP